MPIFLRELKSGFKSWIFWAVGMVFMLAMGMGKYTAMDGEEGSIEDLVSIFPESMQSLWGVGIFDWSNVVDFYAVLYMYLAFIVGAFALTFAIGIITKEHRDKTADFLFVKPVSRSYILFSKFLAALVYSLLLWIVTCISSYLAVLAVGEPESLHGLYALFAGLLGMQIAFMCLGILIGTLIQRHKLAAAVGMASLMTMFVLKIFVDMFEQFSFLRYISFFKYFDAAEIVVTGYPAHLSIVGLIINISMVVAAFVIYKRSDVYA